MQSNTAAKAALIPDPQPTPWKSDAAPATPSQMRVLSPDLPFHEDETPLSYAIRLAALHTGGSPAAFLRDIGVDPQSLIDGKPAAIVKLAEVGGADPAALAHNTIEVLDGGLVRCRGETFDRRLVVRQGLRFCPHCMMEDAGSSAKRNASRLRLRFGWDLKFVETCSKHGTRFHHFHNIEHCYNGLPFAGDWQLWNAIRNVARQERPVAESSLQRYVLGRLDGAAGPNWLDSLPLDQSAQACHLLGAVALKGARPQSSTFSLEERAEASELGFAIASEGEAGIRRLLTDLQRRCPSRDGHAGPQAMFGDLYDWAARTDRDRGPLADILRQHILETVPVGPGDIIFWETVTERRVHSVRTLSLATGVHPKRLRKLLEARGLIDAQDRDTHDHRVVFNAAAGEAVARAITDSIPMADLHGRLGLGRAVTTRLVSDGLLTPVLVPDDDLALKERRFLRDEVDAFIERCLADAEPVGEAPPGFDNLRRAASAVAITVAALLRAVLDGRIRDRMRLTTGRALGSLIVNVEAVRTVFTPDPAGEEYARYRAARRLGTTDRVIAALIADGPGGPILESRPKTNSPGDRARVIPAPALDAFARDYVGLIHLARERRLHHLAVAATLHERGVTPAFDPTVIQATFYRRDQIPADI